MSIIFHSLLIHARGMRPLQEYRPRPICSTHNCNTSKFLIRSHSQRCL